MFGQVLGAAIGIGPKNPKVPELPRVDTQKVLMDTIAANQAVLPNAQALATSVNTFNQEEILRMLREAIPGYDAMTGKAGEVINAQLAGKVPQDVQNLVQSKAAAKALSGGYAGSGMAEALGLRDLGLTSLQMTQQGLNSAAMWLQTMKNVSVPPQFRVENMFDSPGAALDREERYLTNKWQRDWTQAQIKALGSPLNQAMWANLGQFDKTTWSIAEKVGAAYAGGALGGAGGAASGAAQSQDWINLNKQLNFEAGYRY